MAEALPLFGPTFAFVFAFFPSSYCAFSIANAVISANPTTITHLPYLKSEISNLKFSFTPILARFTPAASET